MLLAATIVGAIAIGVLGPHHVDLQSAADADAFRSFARDDPGGHLAAAAVDIAFAVSYGLLGVVGLRRLGGEARWVRIGQALVVVGAGSDVIENVFLLRNISTRDSLTDGWVDAMQVPGTLKWVAAPGIVLLHVLAVRAIVSKLRGHAHGAGGEA